MWTTSGAATQACESQCFSNAKSGWGYGKGGVTLRCEMKVLVIRDVSKRSFLLREAILSSLWVVRRTTVIPINLEG